MGDKEYDNNLCGLPTRVDQAVLGSRNEGLVSEQVTLGLWALGLAGLGMLCRRPTK